MTTLAGADAVATTPTLRAAARRSRFWVLAGVGALLVAIAATLLAGAGSSGGTPLAADNAAPAGARALVEVLRQQGCASRQRTPWTRPARSPRRARIRPCSSVTRTAI
ncbi:hypothetical protein [Cryobacterium sp. 10C3]|uniref:hypothetical protein n=1 Tax=Cryobacterium sp. 10C3 TaxID=3048577 RepID=UPI002AB56B74|nr:hypothetical protein [Cryobacterium sp. 10C3]MDY7557479.1 hypothetical protein [Cryobacterium sp. 10C3]